MNDKLNNWIYMASALLLLLATAGLFIANIEWMAWPLLIGGLGYTVSHMYLYHIKKSSSTRFKRLIRMAVWSGICWVAAAIVKIMELPNVWQILIIIAVLFMAYSNITMVVLHEKESKQVK